MPSSVMLLKLTIGTAAADTEFCTDVMINDGSP